MNYQKEQQQTSGETVLNQVKEYYDIGGQNNNKHSLPENTTTQSFSHVSGTNSSQPVNLNLKDNVKHMG